MLKENCFANSGVLINGRLATYKEPIEELQSYNLRVFHHAYIVEQFEERSRKVWDEHPELVDNCLIPNYSDSLLDFMRN